MAKKLRRDKLREGLTALGYFQRHDVLSPLWFEYSPGVNAQPLFEGPHRILVGRKQAIRYTRSTIDRSHGLAANMVERILEAYNGKK